MIKLFDYKTWKAFPAEMRTPERIALAYAYDRQKQKFMERFPKTVSIISSIACLVPNFMYQYIEFLIRLRFTSGARAVL